MPETDAYLDLITPEHAGKPRFAATVALSVDPLVRLQNAIRALVRAFDLDYAVGPQLDGVGERIGCSRYVSAPIENIYFSFGDSFRGFGQGSWKGPFDGETFLTALDDDTYRRLLRARILANSWDGTATGAQAILDAFFQDPLTKVFVQDDGVVAYPTLFFTFGDPQRGFGAGRWKRPEDLIANIPSVDMAMTIGVSGRRPPLVILALLADMLIPVKPEGVRLTQLVTSVDDAPLFGFGIDNAYVGGFGRGTWGVPPGDILDLGNPFAGSLDFSIPGNPLITLF